MKIICQGALLKLRPKWICQGDIWMQKHDVGADVYVPLVVESATRGVIGLRRVGASAFDTKLASQEWLAKHEIYYFGPNHFRHTIRERAPFFQNGALVGADARVPIAQHALNIVEIGGYTENDYLVSCPGALAPIGKVAMPPFGHNIAIKHVGDPAPSPTFRLTSLYTREELK